ncbi:hypothetical protein B0H10DRAFT_1937737 [Mycena sp. CBHHK59/15]|nr:hypothetical protein B0H10DRAFT_1937737 [Mycena sp. CBHHK59/15]
MMLDTNTTPSDLENNPTLLLHTQHELPRQGSELIQKKLHTFDAIVGSIFSSGNEFIVSPNRNVIYEPQTGIRRVQLHRDFRYGPNNHTLWPQLYALQWPHHGCIPACPVNMNDQLAVFWWDPSSTDFVPLDGNILRGLVTLKPEKMSSFRQAVDKVVCRAARLEKPNILLSRILNALKHLMFQLQHLPTNPRMTCFTITKCQRYALEAIGLVDYLEIYLPRINGNAPPATYVADTVGVFIGNDQLAQEFFQAGDFVLESRSLVFQVASWTVLVLQAVSSVFG